MVAPETNAIVSQNQRDLGYNHGMPAQNLPPSQPHTSQGKASGWFWDALASIAFAILALVGGKGASRAVGPAGAFIVFTIAAGLSWRYGRLAWRNFLAARS